MFYGIMLYDARENAYTLVDHNIPNKVDAELELRRHRKTGLPAFIIEHAREHATLDAAHCHACRTVVQKAVQEAEQTVKRLIRTPLKGKLQ